MAAIAIPKGTVVKIASAATTGNVRNLSFGVPQYFLAIKVTDPVTADPSVADMSDFGSLMFAQDGVNEPIESSAPIDIYEYSPVADAKIRVDLP